MRVIGDAGLALIKSFEGLRLGPYMDSAGTWTIGYGHTRDVTQESDVITETEADDLLHEDLAFAELEVSRTAKVDLNQNQFDALVSLVFNVGSSPLFMTLGKKLNLGDYEGVAEEFLVWNHAGGLVIDGLTRRREAEKQLFLTPVEI